MATMPVADPATWTDEEPLECCSVVPEAPDTATISFVAPGGAHFSYRPGQFLTLELPLPGGSEWRADTISSSPSRPLGVSLTVKARTAGEVHMAHSGGISDEDVADGYILACCSHPIGRVTVEA